MEENDSGEEENGNVEDNIGESYSQTEDEEENDIPETSSGEEQGEEKIRCSSCRVGTVYSLDITEEEVRTTYEASANGNAASIIWAVAAAALLHPRPR